MHKWKTKILPFDAVFGTKTECPVESNVGLLLSDWNLDTVHFPRLYRTGCPRLSLFCKVSVYAYRMRERIMCLGALLVCGGFEKVAGLI